MRKGLTSIVSCSNRNFIASSVAREEIQVIRIPTPSTVNTWRIMASVRTIVRCLRCGRTRGARLGSTVDLSTFDVDLHLVAADNQNKELTE